MHFDLSPAVSIIIPTRNRAGVLCDAVESVLAQTCRTWELLVVDDGSSDNTFELIEPLLRKYSNIRYLKHSNRGAALSRNAGIQASFGRYITFLDSDDRYLPEHLESRLKLIDANPDVKLLSGGFLCEGDPWVRDRHNPGKLVHVNDCILGGTLFGQRDFIVSLGGFRPLDYAEDTDLWERAATKGRIMAIDSPKSYIYRRSPDSITSNYEG